MIRSPLILSSVPWHPSGVYGPVKVLVEIPRALKDGNKSLEGSLESWGRKPWPPTWGASDFQISIILWRSCSLKPTLHPRHHWWEDLAKDQSICKMQKIDHLTISWENNLKASQSKPLKFIQGAIVNRIPKKYSKTENASSAPGQRSLAARSMP